MHKKIILALFLPLGLLSILKSNNLTSQKLFSEISIIINYVLDSEESEFIYILKKTGQTVSYYTGDDGSYQKGIALNYSRSNSVVIDHVTGLEWQDNLQAKTIVKNWIEAKDYCVNLDLNGIGWRLPTIQELQSIVEYGAISPSMSTIFKNYTSGIYWSLTTLPSLSNHAYYVDFDRGSTEENNKASNYHVRCVR